jgi:hypothetical protein
MCPKDPLQHGGQKGRLTDKYWAAFDDVNGVHLARMLSWIRAKKQSSPLPRIAGLTAEQRAALERELVERSIAYAREHLGPM